MKIWLLIVFGVLSFIAGLYTGFVLSAWAIESAYPGILKKNKKKK